MSEFLKVSVIIPTYKRSVQLLAALQSLQKQTIRNFEIVVVDNAGEWKTFKLIEIFNKSAEIAVKYVAEPLLGLHNARHTGARVCRGEILVFTDDDATFEEGWLEGYLKAFSEHPNMVAAGGPVRPIWEVEPPEWLVDFMGDEKVFPILSLMEPYEDFRLEKEGFFFGVNMAIRRNILFEVGGFNPDAFGDFWLGDGETGLHRKLWEKQMLIGYVPNAVVFHHIPRQRMTVEYFCRRMANEGSCDIYAEFHKKMPSRLALLKKALSLLIINWKIWLKGVLVQGKKEVGDLSLQIYAARTRSQFAYLMRLMFDAEFQRLVLKENWLTE